MSSRRRSHSTAWMVLAACLFVSEDRSVARAEDWLETNPLWQSSLPVVRGQEAESSEARGEENPFAEHIETDRDSFTPSTRTVNAGRWVIESSYSFIDNRDTADTHSLPELLLRYGIADWIELRLGGNYEVGGEGGDVSTGGGGR